MKRALTAAIFGGLLAVSVPQAAIADHESGGHEATQPEATPEPEQNPPPAHPYGDKEHHDDEEGTILF